MTAEMTKSNLAAPGVVIRRRLIVLGTDVTLHEQIRERAISDLGLDLEYRVMPERLAETAAIKAPADFDIYDHFFHSLDLTWSAGVIGRIETDRLSGWENVSSLSREGSLGGGARLGRGELPVEKLFIQPDGALGSKPSGLVSMLPLVHNVDSFVYVQDDNRLDDPQSWAWLLDERWHGKVTLINNPALGLVELGLAAHAKGDVRIRDIGCMTIAEIDQLFLLLQRKVKEGHFMNTWNTSPQVEACFAGQARIGSCWSKSLLALRRMGMQLRSAVPKEGYRAWHGGMSLSARLSGADLDAAYDYMNWWLAGWPGAMMARMGHYVSATEPVRNFLTEDEWGYWYMGKAAQSVLIGIDGAPLIMPGDIRDGGSYSERVSRIAVWNSTMPDHNYVTRKWREITRTIAMAAE